MKKALFTIQMIALIAMFPVYLVTELNHETGRLPVNNSPSEFKEIPEESNFKPALNTGYEELSSSVIKINAYYFNQ
jgi:hypothetical protein